MVISRTPLRVSLAGGGTDLPEFYNNFGWGAVTSTAIHAYVTILVEKKFDGRVRAAYSELEDVDEVSQIRHSLIRECLKRCGVKDGIEVMSHSDIPGNSGLGGSSAFTVGLLNALFSFLGRPISKNELAEEAYEIEYFLCGAPLGKQDHYIASFGGTRHFVFEEKKVTVLTPRGEIKSRLNKHLLMFYVGNPRSSDVILKDMQNQIGIHTETLNKMREQAVKMYVALKFWGTLDNPGDIIWEGWRCKRLLSSKISDEHIDGLVEKALEAGAKGGKICGAGGGGFLVLWAHPSTHENIRSKLGLREWPVKVGARGSRIIYAD